LGQSRGTVGTNLIGSCKNQILNEDTAM
jgi:hypothetical protein